MADNKKNFIVYTSWRTWLDVMTTEQKGEWLDWVMAYCNDEEPELPTEPVVKMGCSIARENLKRDLVKYEAKVESIKQARERKLQASNNTNQDSNLLKSSSNQDEINMKSSSNQVDFNSVNVNDNVNVNVNVKDNVINLKENLTVKEKVVDGKPLTPYQKAINDFVTMRNKIKKPLTEQAKTRLMNKLEELSKGNEELKIKILNQSVDHCWQDIYELKENKVQQVTKGDEAI